MVEVNVLSNVMIGLFAGRCGFDKDGEGDVEFLVVYMKQEDYPTLTCQVVRTENEVSLVCSLLSKI